MKIKFNKKAEAVFTSDLYYDLFNGYFKELIENTDKNEEITEAITLLESFLEQAQNKELLEIG